MRFSSLGSGSRGNATLVEQDRTCLMVDCGFSIRETETRLARLQKTPHDIAAILVTHEHSDHVRGVGSFARKHNIPVWMTPGTHAACNDAGYQVEYFSSHEAFAIGNILVEPFPVPHDAREPAQFVFSNGNSRLGLLTDTGSCTPFIQEKLSGLDALILESNHDHEMLMQGNYPPSLKQRVAGRFGHLSNLQASEILKSIETSRLQHLVAAHLSEKNNHPDKVLELFCEALDCEPDWVCIATQNEGFYWRTLA